jgi:hypothetical protein
LRPAAKRITLGVKQLIGAADDFRGNLTGAGSPMAPRRLAGRLGPGGVGLGFGADGLLLGSGRAVAIVSRLFGSKPAGRRIPRATGPWRRSRPPDKARTNGRRMAEISASHKGDGLQVVRLVAVVVILSPTGD